MVPGPLNSYELLEFNVSIFSCLHHSAPDAHDAVRFLRVEEFSLLLTEVKQTRRSFDSHFERTFLMNLDKTMMKC